MIRVLVVDDDPMVCAHLTTILEAAQDIAVVGCARDGAEAVECVLRHVPDVVLMDMRMPGVDGIAASARIGQLGLATRVVALTSFDDDATVLSALRAGVHGFLLKSTPPEDLVALVRVAASGHAVLSAQAMARMTGAAPAHEGVTDALERLTAREHDVLALVAAGLSNAQIARRLCLSEATIKGYVSRILDKLGCANRTQASRLVSRGRDPSGVSRRVRHRGTGR